MSAESSLKGSNTLPSAPEGGVVVFDLDGTLVDSIRDLLPALNYTIAREGLSPISQEVIGKVVGQGALKMIERAFSLQNRPLDSKTHKELLSVFLERYEEHTASNTVFFKGCLPLLDRLTKNGWALAVCTNKFEHLARKLLDELEQSHRFAAITGGDTFSFKKPDGRHIIETVKRADGVPHNSVMVGDSISDIAGARDASIPVIAVDFGYTDVPVADLNPDRVISDFCSFDKALAEICRH